MIFNSSESLAKPLVMAKLNMAYLSNSKNQRYDDFKLIRITCQAACHGKTEHGIFVNLKNLRYDDFILKNQRYDDFKLIKITCQAACHGKTEHGIFVNFKKPAKLLSSYLPVSSSRVLRAPGTSPYHLVPKHLRTTWSRPEQSHLFPEA